MNEQDQKIEGTESSSNQGETKSEKRLQKRAMREASRNRARRKAGSKKAALWIVLIAVIASGFIIGLRDRDGNNKNNDQKEIIISEMDQVTGPSDAAVTLVEFADFQCPACGAYHPLLQQLKEQFPDDLRTVFKHFPLSQIHPNALPAGIASEAAGRQDKFWEMHDLLFERQSEWSGALDALNVFKDYAEELGLDAIQFEADMQDKDLRDIVLNGVSDGTRLGVRGTPTFFVNGMQIQNPQSAEAFAQIIQNAIGDEGSEEAETLPLGDAMEAHQ